jgi:hypothetical protein
VQSAYGGSCRGSGGVPHPPMADPQDWGIQGVENISKQLLRMCYTTRQTKYILGLPGYLLVYRYGGNNDQETDCPRSEKSL